MNRNTIIRDNYPAVAEGRVEISGRGEIEADKAKN